MAKSEKPDPRNEASRRIDEAVEDTTPTLAPFHVQKFLDWVREQTPEPEPLVIPRIDPNDTDPENDPFTYDGQTPGLYLAYDEFLNANGLHHLDNARPFYAEGTPKVPDPDEQEFEEVAQAEEVVQARRQPFAALRRLFGRRKR